MHVKEEVKEMLINELTVAEEPEETEDARTLWNLLQKGVNLRLPLVPARREKLCF